MAKALLDAGQSQAEASRRTGIPRSTIGVWVKRGPAKAVVSEPCSPCQHIERVAALPVYAYLLGLYLGDGCISRHRRGVHRLRIALDLSYPGIIAECATAMASVLPNRVGQVRCEGYAEVTSYSRHWPCLFPQAGAGPKHKRPIVLDTWQHEGAIVRNPEQLLRGLIHSDGWRGTNVAVKGKRRYSYPRYLFSNRSEDIRGIFAEACHQVGVACHRSNEWVLSVARQSDVARLDHFIGPKR
jgi:hypothetical protein